MKNFGFPFKRGQLVLLNCSRIQLTFNSLLSWEMMAFSLPCDMMATTHMSADACRESFVKSSMAFSISESSKSDFEITWGFENNGDTIFRMGHKCNNSNKNKRKIRRIITLKI